MKTGYIFAMRLCRRIQLQVLWALALASSVLRAAPGDVDNSHDYPDFPRPPGYLISDYDEDNPADFDFPVASPLPLDADHVELIHVSGHRYVIRYEFSGGNAPTLFQTQQYYEKLADHAGYSLEKSGAVGNVTETFRRISANVHVTWVYLEPANNANILTIVESAKIELPAPPAPPRIVAASPAPTAAFPLAEPAPAVVPVAPPPPRIIAASPAPTAAFPAPTASLPASPSPVAPPRLVASPPAPVMVVPATAPSAPGTPAPLAPAPTPPLPPLDPNDDSLYVSLNGSGRIVVPFVFQPGRDELDASSQRMVERIVLMMNRHPDLFLRIEGHTDNSGDPDINLRLSAQRAIAVQNAIIDEHVNPKRLDAVGVGGLQPLADNNTADGRAKNRRIELVLWKKYPFAHTPAANGKASDKSGL